MHSVEKWMSCPWISIREFVGTDADKISGSENGWIQIDGFHHISGNQRSVGWQNPQTTEAAKWNRATVIRNGKRKGMPVGGLWSRTNKKAKRVEKKFFHDLVEISGKKLSTAIGQWKVKVLRREFKVASSKFKENAGLLGQRTVPLKMWKVRRQKSKGWEFRGSVDAAYQRPVSLQGKYPWFPSWKSQNPENPDSDNHVQGCWVKGQYR